MGTFRVVSVSGGKDSTALYLWAIENWGHDFSAVFADTGHEHPVTYNYLRNLPAASKGPAINWVKADFKERVKRRYLNTETKRSDGAQAFINRNRAWLESVDYSSGNPFLDLIMWKGRVPAAKSQFCTEHLKLEPIKEFIESNRGDLEVINYVGIRAAESPRRAKMPEKEFSKYFDCDVYRPLLKWSEQDVFDQLKRHAVAPNPLYEAGFSRVGCFPCIHARKGELARLPEWAWKKLEEWEKIIGRSWFPPGTVPGIVIPTTEQARQWSKTSRGGRQIDMMAPDASDVPSCMSTWGTCE